MNFSPGKRIVRRAIRRMVAKCDPELIGRFDHEGEQEVLVIYRRNHGPDFKGFVGQYNLIEAEKLFFIPTTILFPLWAKDDRAGVQRLIETTIALLKDP